MYRVSLKVLKYNYFEEKIIHTTKSWLKALFLYYFYKSILIYKPGKYQLKMYKINTNLIYLKRKTYFWNN